MNWCAGLGGRRGEITDQFVEPSGSRIKDCLSVKRRNEPGTELLDSVRQGEDDGEEFIWGIRAISCRPPAFRSRCSGWPHMAPGFAFEGKLLASQAGGKDIGIEADLSDRADWSEDSSPWVSALQSISEICFEAGARSV